MPPPDFSGTRAPIPGPAPGSADSASHRAAALPATDIRPLIPDAKSPMAPADANPAEVLQPPILISVVFAALFCLSHIHCLAMSLRSLLLPILTQQCMLSQAAGVKEPFQGQKGRAVNPWTSQITAPSPAAGSAGATPLSQAGFRRLVAGKGQNLTLLSIEVHADTRFACVSHFTQCHGCEDSASLSYSNTRYRDSAVAVSHSTGMQRLREGENSRMADKVAICGVTWHCVGQGNVAAGSPLRRGAVHRAGGCR